MAIDRKKLGKVNVKANLKVTQGDRLFVNVKEDTILRVRFMPPADGIIFTVSCNHFKLQIPDDEGGPPRGVALACLEEHGDGKTACYLCRLERVLKKSTDKAERKIAKDIRQSVRYNAQVLIAERDDNKSPWSYYGPKIIGLPKTAADDITGLLATMQSMGQPLFTEIEQGQDILISRTGTGFQTRYTRDRSGEMMSLDDIFPEWTEKYIEDMNEALGLRVVSPEEQKATAVFTYGDALDWDELSKSGL